MQTRDVAEYATYAVGRPLDAHLDRWSRWALLDTLSVAAAGRRTSAASAAARMAARSPGSTPSLDGSVRTVPSLAAFVDATAANALDFDDGHYLGGGIHPGSTVVPALLAVSDEATALSRLRAALVVGYEVAVRAGRLLSPAHGRAYRTSGHAASLGAAVAVTALLGGGRDEVSSALRIAASHAPVSAVHAGGARESIGWASATAVTAAFLALDGFTDEAADATFAAPVEPSPFDDDTVDPFVDSLGEASEAVACYVKPYACCRVVHAALDALESLRRDLPSDPTAIESVTIGTSKSAISFATWRPLSLEQAQFSIPTMAAVYLLEHELGPEQARADRYDSPAVHALAERIHVRHDARLDDPADKSYPASVDVLADGRLRRATIRDAKGSRTNPLSEAERRAKARSCLLPGSGPDRAQAVIDLIVDQDGEPTLAELRPLIAASPPPLERA